MGVLTGCAPSVTAMDTDASSTSTGAGECVVGQVTCECTPGGGCDPGLECIVGLCIPEDDVSASGMTMTSPPDTSATDPDDTSATEPEDTSATDPDTSATDTSTTEPDDGSTTDPIPKGCGDGRLEDPEECDDSNNTSGDGCNADCTLGGQEIWTVVLDGGQNQNDEIHSLAIDEDDDIYFAGIVLGLPLNDYDGFLARYDDDGQQQWTRTYDSGIGTASDGYYGVAVAEDQSVVVAGWTQGDMGSRQPFVRMYSDEGDILWTHIEADVADTFAYDVDVDSLGDIVVVGSASDPDTFQSRTWLAKFAPDGDEIWNQRIVVPSNGVSLSVEVDSSDAIAISGFTGGTGHLRRLDSDGDELWTWSDALVGNGALFGLATDADNGIYIAGVAAGQLHTYLAHHPEGGIDPDWSEEWMGTQGFAANAWAVAVDGAGNIIMVGDQTSNQSNRHVFARKLDPEGNEAWVHDVDVLDTGYDILFAVAIDSQDQPVIAGRVRNANGHDEFWMRKLTQ